MTLPATITTFDLDLPWPVDFGGGQSETVTMRYARAQWRTYGHMEAAEYQDAGPSGQSFVIVMNHYSFIDQTPADMDRAMVALVRAVARYQIAAAVVAAAPLGYPLPSCCGWPLTAAAAAHLDAGTGTPPVLRGTAAAFRVLPASAYATTTQFVAAYRGTPVPD